MTALSVRSLARAYGDDIVAVRDVSFTVEDGRIAALLGPSGSGKSTVLRLIAGLDRPDAGEVLLGERSVLAERPEQRGIGLMFQELALFPHLDVRDNVAFGLRMARWVRHDRELRVMELLDMVGLRELARRRIDELSGGERQRVALARTLAPRPAVLLLDEPLGSLDEELKRSLRADLRALLREVRTTALIVSHDLRDAVAIADDLVVMDAGMVLQAGALGELMAHPGSAAVAALLGYVTLAEGEVANGAVVEVGVGVVVPPGERLAAGRARVMAHPSALLAVPAGLGLGCGVRGAVRAARPDGPQQLVEVVLGERVIEARWEWDLEPPPPGTAVDLATRPGTLRCFALDDDGAAVPAPAAPANDPPAAPHGADDAAWLEAVAEPHPDAAPEATPAPAMEETERRSGAAASPE